MNITICGIGNLKEKFFRQASEEYLKRLSRFGKIQIIELKEEHLSQQPSKKEIEIALRKEAVAILQRFGEDYLIGLDVEGESFSSEYLSKKLEKYDMKGIKPVFLIGSSYGLHSEVKNKCIESWSFSKMTFPHQLMRVILLEQIYRGMKIKAGEIYHK